MAVEISIAMDAKIRKDIMSIANNSGDHNLNLIFSSGKLTLLGYTETSFCICNEFIENTIPYIIRLEDSVLLSIMGCNTMKFSIDKSTVTVSGYDSNESLVRQAQVRLSSDSLATYQADFYQSLIENLRAGVPCKSMELLGVFDKISRVNAKGSRGVVLSNNQIYTEGEGFKFFAKYKTGFNCFVVSDDLRNLISFVGDNDCILYEPNGYIVAKDSKDCYFGVRVADPPDNSHDLEIVLKQKYMLEFNISFAEVKKIIRPIRVSNLKYGTIIFMASKNRIVLSLGNTVYNIPHEYKDVSGETDLDIKLDFKIFNKLLQAMSIGNESNVRVYNNFVSISGNNDSLLLVARR